jgi:hypothetical protein
MIGASMTGKTYLTQAMIDALSNGPRIRDVLFISTKPGNDVLLRRNVVPGEVIRDQKEIESGSDGDDD